MEQTAKVSSELEDVILEYGDFLMNKIPVELSQRREVDHKIEVFSGIQPHSKAQYMLNQVELVELKWQLE